MQLLGLIVILKVKDTFYLYFSTLQGYSMFHMNTMITERMFSLNTIYVYAMVIIGGTG